MNSFAMGADDGMKFLRIKTIIFVIAVAAAPYAAYAQQASGEMYLSCFVDLEDDQGEWVASRELTVRGAAVNAGRDRFTWRPKAPTQLAPGVRMKWDISYNWPTDPMKPREVREDRVALRLDFWLDAEKMARTLKNPNRTWLHIYRSSDVDEKFSSTDTSLASMMFWHQHRNGNLDSAAVIPLDHVLAYGAGHDVLVWNIRGAPDVYGGTRVELKGTIPLATMRGKIDDIPKLRRALDRKAASYRTECRAPVMAPPSVGG